MAVAALFPRHTFQLLTKRPGRMREYFCDTRSHGRVMLQRHEMSKPEHLRGKTQWVFDDSRWPLPNVWLGVTAENQARADERIPVLLDTPAAVRFVSAEPMLGPVDLERWMHRTLGWDQQDPVLKCPSCGFTGHGGYFTVQSGDDYDVQCHGCGYGSGEEDGNLIPSIGNLSWLICGAETGLGARPMDLAWARNLRIQCAEAGVPFFFKKAGRGVPTPEDLNIREFPGEARQ
jgi:protein gp37